MRQDLFDNCKAVVATNYTHVTGNGTTTGNILAMDGFRAITFLVQLHAWTDGVVTPNLVVGNASNLSDGANVVAAAAGDYVDPGFLLDGTLAGAAVTTTANSVKRLGYNGVFRYVRLDLVASAVTTGCFVSALAIQSEPLDLPIAGQ